MAIVKLKKITLFTTVGEEKSFLSQLQEKGALHIIPLREISTVSPEREDHLKETVAFLKSAPYIRKQLHIDKGFNPESVRAHALHLKISLKEQYEERDSLKKRIKDLLPWGDFTFPSLSEMGKYRFWFYRIPHRKSDALEHLDLIWQKVGKDHQFDYVVVIAKEKPLLPYQRVHVGSTPLHILQQRLEATENAIEELQAKRIALTKWLDLYQANIARLEDKETFLKVQQQIYKDDDLLVVQAWIPQEREKEIRMFAKARNAALLIESPSRTQTPPTLLKNRPLEAAGEDLLTFYTVPNYWEHDSSSVIFYAFILFFSIILGDAGYGCLLGIITLLLVKKLRKDPEKKRFFYLLLFLSLGTMVWGILVGSYFGLTPPEDSWLKKMQLLQIDDYDSMMQLSILIGIVHLLIANGLKAVDLYRQDAYLAYLQPVGWIIATFGGTLLYLYPSAKTAGIGLVVLGAVLILLFTNATEQKPIKRLFGGLTTLTQITSLFGDILSYLRLFALGLATASMAIAFNHLAQQVLESFAGIGVLFALFVLLIGHMLNFSLGIVSGVVHGLRLNLIEYLKWSSKEEGYPFQSFRKKEKQKWNN